MNLDNYTPKGELEGFPKDKKSNREIAEEIWDEIHYTYGALGFDSKKEIEIILNKYL